MEWFPNNYESLVRHRLVCRGTTDGLVEEALQEKLADEEFQCRLERLKSGPPGGGLAAGRPDYGGKDLMESCS